MATFRSEELPSADDLNTLRQEMRKQIDLVFAVLMDEVESDRTDRLLRLADRYMQERDDAQDQVKIMGERLEEIRTLAWGYREAAHLLDASIHAVLRRGGLNLTDRERLATAHERHQRIRESHAALDLLLDPTTSP